MEDGKGELWDFVISKETHDQIEADQGSVIGRFIMWDTRKRSMRFL
jgi:hypothetical protein